MIYKRIVNVEDPDIPYLTAVLKQPDIARFISIDEANYWTYIAKTENVFYFKAFESDILVAATHCEIINDTLYMDIMVIPAYQRNGIATKILNDIRTGTLPIDFEKIKIAIDKSNTASIRLFEKMNFKFVSAEDELLNYAWVKSD